MSTQGEQEPHHTSSLREEAVGLGMGPWHFLPSGSELIQTGGVQVLRGLEPQPETLAPQTRCQGESLPVTAHRAASWWQQLEQGEER